MSLSQTATPTADCPFQGVDDRRTSRPAVDGPGIAEGADGVWRVRSFDVARQILRGGGTKQAGFKAELVDRLPERGKVPILFLEGTVHHEQRRLTAPFFTPRTVSTRYRTLMETLVARLMRELRQTKRGDLSLIAADMAVNVAAEVVGLTDSAIPGLDTRINAFFIVAKQPEGRLARIIDGAVAQWRLLKFYWLDVRPAIRVRRTAPKEDVISHLLTQNYSNTEILTECITYGAAGMITTREFITACVWHLLENDDLRQRYVAADEPARHAILDEILRLEPVVGNILRRTTEAVVVDDGGAAITIPQGARIDLDLRGINADPAAVGECPLALTVDRQFASKKASGPVMSFGDGHHRCPGSFLAIQETDMFLMGLLALPGLRLVQPPRVGWSDLVTGYELRDCLIEIA